MFLFLNLVTGWMSFGKRILCAKALYLNPKHCMGLSAEPNPNPANGPYSF
jgi:hypothetical protein